jgi:hypothetical protein
MMAANTRYDQFSPLRPTLGCANNAYGAAEDARIKDSGTRSCRAIPAVLSSAILASMDVAIPPCTVVEVRSTTAAIAIDLVIQPERAMSTQVLFSLAWNHRKVM